MPESPPASPSRPPASGLLRRVAGALLVGPLRNLARPLRPIAVSMGFLEPPVLPGVAGARSRATPELLAWYASRAVSGRPETAQAAAEALLADPRLTDASLFLGMGYQRLATGDPVLAVRLFNRAGRLSSTAHYDFGQRVFDYVHAERPPLDELLILSRLADTPGAMVPDLARLVLEALFEAKAENTAEGLAAIRQVASQLDRGALLQVGNTRLAGGQHATAMASYDLAMGVDPHDVLTRLQMGVTEFLAGRYEDAERQFAVMGSLQHLERARWGVSDMPVTVMHETWLQAVGHIACLDTYVKSMELGWLPKQRSVLAFDTRKPPIGWPLLKYWGQHIEVLGAPDDPGEVLDAHIWNDVERLGRDERDRRRAALMSSFWCGPNAEGRTRWYGPLGSEVQYAWKAAGRGPLLKPAEEEIARFRTVMHQAFGLPTDAWFVLLHVREPGYKAGWEATHAYTRNADIETYDAAIQHIVDRGGWVIRGGDPSMRPIRPRPQVIDYATSSLRMPEFDILLCAECRFFLGTNSGFSLIPPLFGRRCALTNWSPIGTPNWYPDDIFLPKLVRRRATGEPVPFAELYACMAGWSQFQRDFLDEYEKIDNTPEDLLAATIEMFEALEGKLPSAADEARQARFRETTLAGGGYLGSRLSSVFTQRYENLL